MNSVTRLNLQKHDSVKRQYSIRVICSHTLDESVLIVSTDEREGEGAEAAAGRGGGGEQSREDPETQSAARPGGPTRVQRSAPAREQQPQEETQVNAA